MAFAHTLSPEPSLLEAEDSHFGEDVDQVAVTQPFALIRAFPASVRGRAVQVLLSRLSLLADQTAGDRRCHVSNKKIKRRLHQKPKTASTGLVSPLNASRSTHSGFYFFSVSPSESRCCPRSLPELNKTATLLSICAQLWPTESERHTSTDKTRVYPRHKST